jgi:taurine dioxygenase
MGTGIMSYTFAPLTSHQTGAEICGIDLGKSVDDATRRELNAAFARYHVLVFRDQKLPPADFARAGEIFGPIMSQHHKQIRASGHAEVFEIKNEEIAPGKYRISGETFHTDHSNHPRPPKATALHPVSLPSRGGDTQFVNMHNAYDDLPEAMKRRLHGLMALHVFESRYSPREMRPLDEASRKALPPPGVHPIVRTHRENGRKSLYLNPVRMESVVGMDDDEAQALIAELMAHATQKKYEYRHRWLPGDMVVWDNRSVMHQANGDYDMKEIRHLYRIIIEDQSEPVAAATATGAVHSPLQERL